MSTIRGLVMVLGRVLLSAIFLMSVVGNNIPNFNKVAGMMEVAGIPAPQFMLMGAIVFLIAGSVSVILGYKAGSATLLLVFLVLATYYFHHFWSTRGPPRQTGANDPVPQEPVDDGGHADGDRQRRGTDEPR